MNCESVKSVELPDYTMHIMTRAFMNCKNLESITMSEYLPDIGEGAFCGCRSLKSIHLPKRLEKIGKEAFMHCGLEEISIPDTVQSIGSGVFQGCDQLRRVKLPSGMKVIPKAMFAYCKALPEIDIPETVVKINAQAFFVCEALKEIHLPDGLEVISPDVVDYLNEYWFIFQGIKFRNRETKLEKVNCFEAMRMIRDYSISYRVSFHEKLRILIQLTQKTPDDERLKEYFQRWFPNDVKRLISWGFVEELQEVTSVGEMILKEHIDELIRFAIDCKKPEMQVILLNYKREHFGFESIKERTKKMML